MEIMDARSCSAKISKNEYEYKVKSPIYKKAPERCLHSGALSM